MSAPIDVQLRGYTEFFEAQMRVVDLDEIMERHLGEVAVRPIGAAATPPTVRPGRRWLVAVAAASVVLALVGGVAMLSSVPASNAPVATTLPADTTIPNVPVDVATESTWVKVTTDAAGFGPGGMKAAVAGGPGFVAVGSTATDDEGGDAAVWTSADGLTWTRIPHDEDLFADEDMMSIAAAGPGLVAVGSSVWTSVDGTVWSRVPDQASLDNAWMTSVTVGGPGLVAVGDSDEGAAIWNSVDGITWARVPHDDATFGGTSEGGPSAWHVAAGGPGLVAVGIDWSIASDADAAVWTSVDGLTWVRVPHDEEIFGGSGHQAISSVIAAGPGLVAVGVERSSQMQGVVWTSADGLAWTRIPSDFDGPLRSGQMQDVTVSDSGLVAVGWIGRVGGPGSKAGVWTSTDGISWSRVPHTDEAIGSGLMWTILRTDRGLLALGSDGTNASVWTERSAG